MDRSRRKRGISLSHHLTRAGADNAEEQARGGKGLTAVGFAASHRSLALHVRSASPGRPRIVFNYPTSGEHSLQSIHQAKPAPVFDSLLTDRSTVREVKPYRMEVQETTVEGNMQQTGTEQVDPLQHYPSFEACKEIIGKRLFGSYARSSATPTSNLSPRMERNKMSHKIEQENISESFVREEVVCSARRRRNMELQRQVFSFAPNPTPRPTALDRDSRRPPSR